MSSTVSSPASKRCVRISLYLRVWKITTPIWLCPEYHKLERAVLLWIFIDRITINNNSDMKIDIFPVNTLHCQLILNVQKASNMLNDSEKHLICLHMLKRWTTILFNLVKSLQNICRVIYNQICLFWVSFSPPPPQLMAHTACITNRMECSWLWHDIIWAGNDIHFFRQTSNHCPVPSKHMRNKDKHVLPYPLCKWQAPYHWDSMAQNQQYIFQWS